MNREIDRLVIEKVLELSYKESDEFGLWVILEEGEDAVLFRPSENIKDAWIVLEKFDFADVKRVTGYGDDFYSVTLAVAMMDGAYNDIEVRENTAPMAICKAALKSVGVEI
ncbi:hypothetical protein BAOM_3057 [Peribacillus asahii]|uniref:Phage ABA sandwich domain-containing protein n=1 Tax=Peribacillus asahii TaxID=228899 RepID=A0A3Q9RNM7_9BACI|nr:hypothetical protein [Peribacillus asahii]AZV43666.1 hypothetical protein BAOM_3057 [Peribacillus asahii]